MYSLHYPAPINAEWRMLARAAVEKWARSEAIFESHANKFTRADACARTVKQRGRAAAQNILPDIQRSEFRFH